MNPILQKLNVRPGITALVESVPDALQPLIGDYRSVYDAVLGADLVEWALVFVTKQEQIDTLTPLVAEKAEGDAAVWFMYPKGTS